MHILTGGLEPLIVSAWTWFLERGAGPLLAAVVASFLVPRWFEGRRVSRDFAMREVEVMQERLDDVVHSCIQYYTRTKKVVQLHEQLELENKILFRIMQIKEQVASVQDKITDSRSKNLIALCADLENAATGGSFQSRADDFFDKDGYRSDANERLRLTFDASSRMFVALSKARELKVLQARKLIGGS